MTTTWDSGNKSANIALGRMSVAAWTSASNGNWKGVRATSSKSTGKWYIEFICGYRANNGQIWGFGNSSFNTASYPGNDGNSFGYQSEGSTYGLVASGWQGAGFVGEVVKMAIDLDAKLVWARVDASANWNNSGTADPATGTGGKAYTVTGALFPVWSGFGALANGQNNATIINAGGFTHTTSPPSGFSVWDSGTPTGTGISGTTSPSTWDSANKNSNVVLTNGNLTATQSGASNNWCGLRSTSAYDSGYRYFEMTITATSSGGWEGGLQDSDEVFTTGTGPGSSWRSLSFRNGTNDIYFMNVSNGGTVVWAGGSAGQVIGYACDMNRGLVWAKNVTAGGNWNNDANADPVLGKRGSYIGSINSMYIAWAGNRAGGTNDVTLLNTGVTAFTGTPPTGYVAWDAMFPGTMGKPHSNMTRALRGR